MKKRATGIQAKVLGVILPVIFAVIAVILVLIYMSTSQMISKKSETILEVSTENVINTVKAWMNTTITALDSERDTMQYFELDSAKLLDYIKHTANQYILSRPESMWRPRKASSFTLPLFRDRTIISLKNPGIMME